MIMTHEKALFIANHPYTFTSETLLEASEYLWNNTNDNILESANLENILFDRNIYSKVRHKTSIDIYKIMKE